jgi:hypothetical protein
MTIPVNAYVWDEQMDPKDVVDYVVDVSGLLDTANGEGIASYTLTLNAEATALGLTLGTAGYAISQPTPTSYRIWFSISAGFQSNAAFDGTGTSLPMELTITTNSTPARTRQRTLVLKVAQQ